MKSWSDEEEGGRDKEMIDDEFINHKAKIQWSWMAILSA